MVWPALIPLISAVIGAGASVYSASKAADAQKKATKSAVSSEWEAYNQQREDYAPWREAGTSAVNRLSAELLGGKSAFNPETEPGYKFGFQEMVTPYLNAQGAKGKRLSGETLKGLTRYATNYASTMYDNFLNRYFNLAGMGQVGTTGSANAAANFGNNMANVQYQSAINQGNINTGMTAGVAGAAQQGLNNWYMAELMKKMGVINSGTTPVNTSVANSWKTDYNPYTVMT